jgi:hypothetical protein
VPRTSAATRIAATASQRTRDISFREIVADMEQAAGAYLGHRVGKVIAESEAGGVEAASPLLVDLADAPCRMAPWRNMWPAREPLDAA